MDIDLVIDQLCLDIKKALVDAERMQAAYRMRRPYSPAAKLGRRIRILKAMLVAAAKED